ncbi:MAG: clostripain-related cysteine peptidase [Alkalispirochaeta sp.]
MRRRGMVNLITGGVAVLAGIIACAPLHTPTTTSDDAATLSTRDWRVVMIVFDRNSDAPHLHADITEFRDAGLSAAGAHRVVIQDSQIEEGTITYIDGDGERTITDSELRTIDLTADTDLRTLLNVVARYFPADREALFLSGHGRDWTGFGYREDAPEQTLTSTTLAAALSSRDDVPSSQIIICDGSWTATTEWVIPLSHLSVHVVGAAGEVSDGGLDYRAAIPAEPLGTAEEFARHLAAAVTTETAAGGVHLTPNQLSSLPAVVETIAAAGVQHIQSSLRQQELKDAVVDRGVTAGSPGLSWISIGDAAHALHVDSNSDIDGANSPSTRSSDVNRMLLYVTDVDEHGVPTGHRTDYCTNSAHSHLSPQFQALGWAPDHQQRRGFLYQLWYRRF